MRWLLILSITIFPLQGTLSELNAQNEAANNQDVDPAEESEYFEDSEEEDDEINVRSPLETSNIYKEGKVYYTFGNKTLQTKNFNATAAVEAMQHIESKTCIRFMEAASNSSVKPNLRIGMGGQGLVTGSVCVYGATGKNRRILGVSRRPECQTFPAWVNALGRPLGIGVESARPDRDEFLSLKVCSNRRYPRKRGYSIRGQLYDYHSVAHTRCGKNGCGEPKQPNIKTCGIDSSPNGYTVIDADKLNSYYNCQGCYSHRWQNPKNKYTEFNPIDFKVSADEKPAHVCRSYDFGSINVGRFVEGICYIYSKTNASIIQVTPGTGVNRVQVLGYEKKTPIVIAKLDSMEATGYQVRSGGTGNPVPVGRDHDNVPFYLAVGQFTAEGATAPSTVLGWVQENSTTLWGIGEDRMAREVTTWNKLTCI